MTSKVLSRRSKALTLAPVALLSGVWTASLLSPSATAGDAESVAVSLPDGTSVPSEAIESPASLPVPGVIAPAVPMGAADSVVSNASSNGIPAPALSAYQRAAQIIDSADASCNMPWEMLAAIGRVESDHGRYNGNTLTEDGLSTPGIYGIALDGSNGTAVINDTDAGELDNDRVYDRAVGPMQFIPTTWQVVKVDANGDGERNPQDINDASLAAAVYLCSGEDDLGSRAGQEAALFRYNRSDDYVNLVLRIMEAYSSGDFTSVPSGAQAGTTFTPDFTSSISGTREVVRQREVRERREARQRERANNSTGGGGGSTDGGSTPGGSTGTTPETGGSTPGIPSTGGGGGQVQDKVRETTKEVGGAVEETVKNVPKKVEKVVEEPVEEVKLTVDAAREQCLSQGISVLQVTKLANCIKSLTS